MPRNFTRQNKGPGKIGCLLFHLRNGAGEGGNIPHQKNQSFANRIVDWHVKSRWLEKNRPFVKVLIIVIYKSTIEIIQLRYINTISSQIS
jgi:hypothetical protein